MHEAGAPYGNELPCQDLDFVQGHSARHRCGGAIYLENMQ
jgi:hypothetical protein